MGVVSVRKVYEDAEVEVYEIVGEVYTREDVAKAMGKSTVDPFNIVDEWKLKYYSPNLPPHKKTIELYRRHAKPIAIFWKKLPAPLSAEGA